jgi:hypothetical protein
VSLFNQPFAVPSRVKGAVQLLVRERGQRAKRETAEALLSPASLKGEDGVEKLTMVRRTIDECVRLGLFVAHEEFLTLNSDLPAAVRSSDTVAVALPGAILDLILQPSDGPNEDLAASLAWFLAQDALAAPGTWGEFAKALQDQGAKDVLNFNGTHYDNFSYWSRYLGLTIVIASPTPTSNTLEERLSPDPTVCLRRILREVLPEGGARVSAAECLRAVAVRNPLFEGGSIRDAMDQYAPARDTKHLSSTTSLALLRLEEEGTITMRMLGDADALILVDGPARRPVSDVAWAGNARVDA